MAGSFLCWALCGVTLVAAPRQSSETLTYVYGTGMLSCAYWLSRPEFERDGEEWIYGYWSGLNLGNTRDHAVGQHSEGPAIVGETKKICISEPSTTLQEAVNRVYTDFQKRGE